MRRARGGGARCPLAGAGHHPRAALALQLFPPPIGPATLPCVEDSPPPGLISPDTARWVAGGVIAAGLAVLVFLPWGRNWWTLLGSAMIFLGLGIDWRARA